MGRLGLHGAWGHMEACLEAHGTALADEKQHLQLAPQMLPAAQERRLLPSRGLQVAWSPGHSQYNQPASFTHA